jgi:hypothetical protein
MSVIDAQGAATAVSQERAIWRDLQFVKIWAAGIVSSLGSSITSLAIPLIAVGSLRAGAADMGRLGAAGNASFLVFGLLAGVIVDRAPRRLVLVTTTMTSAAVVATIPLLAATGGLRMWHLYAVAFAAGSLTVVHEVALQSILPALRAIALGGGIHNVFSNGAIVALYVLYTTRVVGLSPIQLGLVYAAVGPGALVGSMLAARYTSHFGIRMTLVHMQVLTGAARWLIPVAALTPAPLPILVISEFTMGIARSIFNINQLSLRQTMTPDDLQGRMNASIRFFMWVFVPLGSLAGGFAATRVGLTMTLAIAASVTTGAAVCFLLVPQQVDAAGHSRQ